MVTVLDDIFQEPEAKAVVFSQWLRMHEVLVRRLERRRWGHVLFHGGLDTAGRLGWRRTPPVRSSRELGA